MPGMSVFDIDETLAVTSAKILVVDKTSKKVIKELSNTEFNTYSLGQNEAFDFRSFKDGHYFKATSEPLHEVIDIFKRITSKKRPDSKIFILTARAPFDHDNKKSVREWFEKHGMDMKGVKIIMCGQLAQRKGLGVDATKADVIKTLIEMYGFDTVRLFEDSRTNIKAFEALANELPSSVTLYSNLIVHGKVAKENKLTGLL